MARKILIIEDNDDIKVIYREWFEDAGYEVEIFDDGLAGIPDIASVNPDAIILDIMMPEMNGYEFLEAYKKDGSVTAPVIVVSNLATDEDKEEARKAGAELYLVKAEFEGPDLVKRVDEFLDTQTVT